MFKENYLLNYTVTSTFIKKTNIFLINKNNLFFYELEFIFKLPSLSHNKNKFILMLLLVEKILNNKLIFLVDTRTLSRTRIIKIGCIAHLQKEMFLYFINLYCMHNTPKLYQNEIIFDFSKSFFMKHETNKILSNILLNLDKDSSYYYDYLNEFTYEISFFFKSNLNNMWLNSLYLSKLGIKFNNNNKLSIQNVVNDAWYISLLEDNTEKLLDLSNIKNQLLELDEENLLLNFFLSVENIIEYEFLFDFNFELFI